MLHADRSAARGRPGRCERWAWKIEKRTEKVRKSIGRLGRVCVPGPVAHGCKGASPAVPVSVLCRGKGEAAAS